MGGGDHRCEWRERAEALEARLAQVESTLEKLQRDRFGPRSEKMPPVSEAIRDPARAETERIASQQKRCENAEKKRQLVTRKIVHEVRDDQKTCPKCGGHDFTTLGEGKTTELYELVPARVERQVHVQHAGSGPCRSPIPVQADRGFRSKPITDSGASRSLNA